MPLSVDIEPPYPYPHATANEPVTLHEGPISIQGVPTGTGRLVLRWAPAATLRFEAELDSIETPDAGASLKVDIAGSTADVLLSAVSISSGPAGISVKASGPVSTFEAGNGTGLKELGFQVVNFNDFLTPGPKPAPSFGYPPQVADLRHGGWRIELTAVPKSQEIFRNVEQTGGYVFTHLGRLTREDGALFTVQDAEQSLETLRWLLCFARGAACALPVRWGTSPDNAMVWQSWSSPVVDPWKGRDTWFDEHHGNLLQEIFPAFAQMVADPNYWPPLQLALHWYQKTNTRAGGMEGSIILGLTALELLGALIVVERGGLMTDAKYNKLEAREKLAALLDVLEVPDSIPPRFDELSAFGAQYGWTTAGATLAGIRNGFVHSNRKRREVALAAPRMAKFGAWWLSLWYQELALLYLLDHRGEYRNRVTAEALGLVERVPWA